MYIANGRAEDSPSVAKTETFVGDVWLDPIVPPQDGITINSVGFLPGAHTYWHSHERGQILQVTSGEGWVCSAGGEPRLIRAGDTVWVPPGERHWHGATADSYMVHTATSLGTTNWELPIGDAYAGSPRRDVE